MSKDPSASLLDFAKMLFIALDRSRIRWFCDPHYPKWYKVHRQSGINQQKNLRMTTRSYEWQRYLCPADQGYSRTSDGYLIPPSPHDVPFFSTNAHLRTLDALEDQHFTVVLGEAGIGKSTFLAEAASQLRRQHGEHTVIEESLRSFSSAGDVNSELFQSPEFEAWCQDTGPLFVLLDGVDEIPADRTQSIMQALIRRTKAPAL